MIFWISWKKKSSPQKDPKEIDSMEKRIILDECHKSRRVDGNGHSWLFDGDDPYVICAWCNVRKDAITGQTIQQFSAPNYRNVFRNAADQVYTDIHNGVASIDDAIAILRGILEDKFTEKIKEVPAPKST